MAAEECVQVHVCVHACMHVREKKEMALDSLLSEEVILGATEEQ